MKTNKKLLSTLAIVFACTVLLMWLMDEVFNSFFAEWFVQKFTSTYYDDLGVSQMYIDWNTIRNFLIVAGFVLVLSITLGCHYYVNIQMKKEKVKLSNEISAFFHRNQTGLPIEYAEIENELLKQQKETDRQKDLYEKEAARKQDLITYLAHDLKTPLASVIGYLSFLSEAQDLPYEQRQKYTNIALDKANRLETLINQFFDITRFNLHTIVIQRERVDIRMLLEQLSEEFYPLMQEKHGKIQLQIEQEGNIYVDPDKFGRVLNNVLKNAVSYCYEGTDVIIKEQLSSDTLTIEITNEGDEIPDTKLSMIFEKFYRMDETRSTKKGGAGLGLAIAKEIIEAHGGRITATSTQQFTTFTIQVPLSS